MLVLDKPALLPTMGVGANEDSLVKTARQYIKKKYNKPGNVYIGVVSRIDSFVTGVVVFARTSKAASRLSKQFSEGKPDKTYLAIVPAGRCNEYARLEHYVAKDESKHRMMTVAAGHPEAKHALLEYQLIGEHEDDRLVEIRLMTGRKHQIRVQLSASGIPVVGDRKYGSKRTFTKGIALHSHRLEVTHPTLGERISFTSEPPKYWTIERFR